MLLKTMFIKTISTNILSQQLTEKTDRHHNCLSDIYIYLKNITFEKNSINAIFRTR